MNFGWNHTTFQYNDESLFIFFHRHNVSNPNVLAKIYRNTLKPEWARKFNAFDGKSTKLTFFKNGDLAILSNKAFRKPWEKPQKGMVLGRVNPKGALVYKRQFPNLYHSQFSGLNDDPSEQKLTVRDDSSLLLLAHRDQDTENFPTLGSQYLMQLDRKGKSPCFGQPLNTQLDTVQVVKNEVKQYKPINRPVWVRNTNINVYPAQAKETIHCSEKLYPKAHLGPDTVVCYDSALTLSPGPDTSAFDYQWSTGATTPRINVNNTGQYSIQVTYDGCVARDTIHVTFLYDNPATLPEDTLLCPDDSLSIRVNTNGDQWLWQPPGIDSLQYADTLNQIQKRITQSGTYRLYLDSVTQCPLDTLHVDSFEAPQTGLKPQLRKCPYDSLQLSVDTHKGTFQWQAPDSSNTIYSKPEIWAKDTGTYKLLDIPFGCLIDTVRVSNYPLPPANAGPDTTLCPNQAYTMQGEGGVKYRWIPAQYLSNDTIPDPKAELPHKQAYALIVTNTAGCRDTSQVVLDVHPPLQVNLSASDTVICQGNRLKLTANGRGGKSDQYTYHWANYDNQSKTFQIKPEADRNYRVSLYDSCSVAPVRDSKYVKTVPSPVARFTMEPKDTLFLNQTVRFEDESLNAETIHWQLSQGKEVYGNPNPTHQYMEAGKQPIRQVAKRENGCRDTAKASIYVKDDFEVFIPNAFSPNDDGINDTWALEGRGLSAYKFKIYSRWGGIIYESSWGEQGWDGTYQNANEPVSTGTYLYKIQVKDLAGRVHFYEGTVQVIR